MLKRDNVTKKKKQTDIIRVIPKRSLSFSDLSLSVIFLEEIATTFSQSVNSESKSIKKTRRRCVISVRVNLPGCKLRALSPEIDSAFLAQGLFVVTGK